MLSKSKLAVIILAVVISIFGTVAWAQVASTPTEDVQTALDQVQVAQSALSNAEAALQAYLATTTTSTTTTTTTTAAPTTTSTTTTSTTTTTTAAPTTAPPTTTAWVEPPVVSVPVLTPGTRPVVNIPGTNTRIRFTQPIEARSGGGQAPNMQVGYEHATATGSPRMADPLVTPGDGSHEHDFAGTILTDTATLATIAEFAPVMDPTSKLATQGVNHWFSGIGHQPGLWHPTVYFEGGAQVTIGSGSALNYVRDPGAHLLTDRLFLLPNGCGYVTFNSRYHHVGDGKWRLTIDGPTWARKSLLDCSPIGNPTENHDAFWFDSTRPPWADTDGIPLAKVSWYFKSGDLKLVDHPTPPPLSFGGPNTDIELHMDYVSASTPVPSLDNIQIGQWLLDMLVNAHLFGNTDPLYGRWQLESQ
jgi:hypothetical protein